MSPRRAYTTTKAMKEYWKNHKECEVCGITKDPVSGRRCDIHHIISIKDAPKRAADKNNMVTLCRFHHWWVGHLKNWKKINSYLDISIIVLRGSLHKVLKIGVVGEFEK